MRIFVILTALASATLPTFGQGLESMQIASALGTVIASEKPCGLSYDQAAISAYIESKVPADDMDFPGTLQMMVQGQEYNLGQMSESAKTAHCTQVARAAKSYKFIQ